MADDRTSSLDMPPGNSGDSVIDRFAEPAGEHARDPHPSGSDAGFADAPRPRALNSSVIIAGVGGWGAIVIAFWLAFAGDPYVMAALFIVSAISTVMLGMIFGLGYWANQTRFPAEKPVHLSFSDFLASDVQTCTGHLPGREILFLIGGISAGLAVGGVGFAIIVSLVS